MGHSTRSIDEFIAILSSAGVEQVIDVRRFPESRRHPHFGSENLPASLASHGIGYLHAPDLGGRREASSGVEEVNGFWRNRSFRNYADYAMSQPFQRALRELLDAGSRRACAIMCAEAVWWRCHRRIITDYLIYHASEVIHLLGNGRASSARMTPAATPTDEGVLVYPA